MNTTTTLPTADFLRDNGEIEESTSEGTVFLYSLNGIEYIIYGNDDVMTRQEDNTFDAPYFPIL